MQEQKHVSTERLYDVIREPMRTSWWGEVASKLEKAGVADPKTMLVVEFGYSVQQAFYIDTPYAELGRCIMRRHDPAFAAAETEVKLASEMQAYETGDVVVSSESVRALAARMLLVFHEHVDRDITNFSPESMNGKLLDRVMQVAGEVYSDTMGYLDMRYANAEQTERAIREGVDPVFVKALCHRLGLMPDAMYLAGLLHQID